MVEASVAERLLGLLQGPYRLWVIVAVMSILGSLAGAFTFCVRRKRADAVVSRRKKTDESTPDDKVVSTTPTGPNTTAEDRTHTNGVAEGTNGVHPLINDDNKQLSAANGLSSHQEGEEPEVEEEKIEAQREGEGPLIKEVDVEKTEARQGEDPLIKEMEEESTEVHQGEEPSIKEVDEGKIEVHQEGEDQEVDVERIEAHQEEEDPLIIEVDEEKIEATSDHQGEDPLIKEVEEIETTHSPQNKEDPLIDKEIEGGKEVENGTEDVTKRVDSTEPAEPENEAHDHVNNEVIATLPNGISEDHVHLEPEADGNVAMVNGVAKDGKWNFPPKLEDFDLMEIDIDPTELELLFADERLVEIYLELDPDYPGLGISIVGGSGSPSGDLPIIIKRVLPNSLAERDGRLKSGDELVAVNENLLVGVAKDAAIETLSNVAGNVRLLVLQDD